VDVAGWRRAEAQHEPGVAPVLLARGQVAVADRRLAVWVRDHQYLGASDNSEPSMALMLPWEVDHGAEFPYFGKGEAATRLMGFMKRLKQRVAADAEMSQWVRWR